MDTIGFLDPVRSARANSGGTWRIGTVLSRDTDRDFLATLPYTRPIGRETSAGYFGTGVRNATYGC
jgi:hypothetical protein